MLEMFYKGNSLITNTESEKTQIRKRISSRSRRKLVHDPNISTKCSSKEGGKYKKYSRN